MPRLLLGPPLLSALFTPILCQATLDASSLANVAPSDAAPWSAANPVAAAAVPVAGAVADADGDGESDVPATSSPTPAAPGGGGSTRSSVVVLDDTPVGTPVPHADAAAAANDALTGFGVELVVDDAGGGGDDAAPPPLAPAHAAEAPPAGASPAPAVAAPAASAPDPAAAPAAAPAEAVAAGSPARPRLLAGGVDGACAGSPGLVDWARVRERPGMHPWRPPVAAAPPRVHPR